MRTYSRQALAAAAVVDQTFVMFERFEGGLSALDRAFQLASHFTVSQGLMVIGPPGSGKTSLARYFNASLPKHSLFAPGFGAVIARCRARPTAGQLVGSFLTAYRYPFRHGSSATVYGRRNILFELARSKGTRIAFLDEAHHLLRQIQRINHGVAGADQEPCATDFLREFMDECNLALVLLGTPLLDRLSTMDMHLSDRISGRHELERYTRVSAQWLGILQGFVSGCTSFDLSYIKDADEAKRLLIATTRQWIDAVP